MAEQFDYQVGGGTVPVIPYDTFEAANFFLSTGRTEEEVLPLLNLSVAQWKLLREVYRWFPYNSGESQRRSYFAGVDDAGILQMVLPPRWRLKPEDNPDLRTTWHIREAVRRNPYIGPFADCDWQAIYISAHPEATLCCYTHDGRTVYFNGRPLIDRKGDSLEVDVESFRAVGGRWLRDRHHIYGQGEFGPKPTFYWYVVEGADPVTFEALNLRYARDKERAYYITNKTIRTKSPDAFDIVPVLRLNYRDGIREDLHDVSVTARDREAVYFYGARLKGARPENFHELGHGYATDGVTVWLLDEKKMIEGADAATFTVPGPGEPYVRSRRGGHGVTDRYRPYAGAEPCDPQNWFEDWRVFFEARPDLNDWWWHRLAGYKK